MFVASLCFALAFGFLEFHSVSARSGGPPVAICDSFLPIGHGGVEGASDLDYVISTNTQTFNPEQTVIISLDRLVDEVVYRGILLHVRNGNNEISGTLFLPNNAFQFLDCPGPVDNTITHNSGIDKTTSSFMWTAPSICETSEYTVRATVVNTFSSYQIGITETLRCISSTIQIALPPTGMPLCQDFSLNMVPQNKYTTSFEEDGDAGLIGWNNVNGAWTRRSGRTPSILTGPDQAEDGAFYLYFEASYPSRPGDRAFLQTDQDLRGCFCLRLEKHQHILDNDASLGIFANNNVLYFSTARDPAWNEIQLQVETPNMTRITIEYTRGYTFLGDIAIDDVRIVPGPC